MKIKDVLKKIWNVMKCIIVSASAIFLGIVIFKKIVGIGKVKDPINWRPVAGRDDQVWIYTGKKEVKIQLPKCPCTKKQVTIDQVEAIGIPFDHEKEGRKLNVEIKHNPTDRRNFIPE